MMWFVGIGCTIAAFIAIYFYVKDISFKRKKKSKPESEPEPKKTTRLPGTFGHSFDVVENVKTRLAQRPDELQYRIDVKPADEKAMTLENTERDDLLLTVTLYDPQDNVNIGEKSVNITRYRVAGFDIMQPMIDWADKLDSYLRNYAAAEVSLHDSYRAFHDDDYYERPYNIRKMALGSYSDVIQAVRERTKHTVENPEYLTKDDKYVKYIDAYRNNSEATEKLAVEQILKPFREWSEKVVGDYRYMQDVSKFQTEWL